MLIILLTLLIGLMLTLMMLPLGYIAPEWILLINIYWAIALPSNTKMLLAFVSGFFVDIVLGQPLGISSLSYVIFIYIILSLYNSLRYMTVPQQMIVLFLLLIVKQHFYIWTFYMFGLNIDYLTLIISTLTTAVLWPFIYFSLRFARRKWVVNEG
ncbi:MAG: rod shape-determining protein MreD [Gammaproteobacteria bacterium]